MWQDQCAEEAFGMCAGLSHAQGELLAVGHSSLVSVRVLPSWSLLLGECHLLSRGSDASLVA